MSATSQTLPGQRLLPRPVAGRGTGWYTDTRLALRLLNREWRAGELRILLLALLVAVAGVTAVSFFVDRMERAMLGRASHLLAADLLITSRDAIPATLASQAQERGLRTARTLTMRSVVVGSEGMRLSEVKAVSEGYPLRGQLRVADSPFGADGPTDQLPTPGSVWVEGRLLAALGLAVGDVVELGAARLRIERVLTAEPDRGGDVFSIAPRVLMHADDIDATQLVQPGSRVRHNLLFAGPAEAIAAWQATLARSLAANLELQGVTDARPELRQALERSRQFLGLAALVGVMLAGAAIAISAARHAERHLDSAALMRCMGAGQVTIVRIYGLQLLVLAVAGGLLGSALGFVAQFGLAALLAGLIVDALPAPGLTPVLAGLGVAMATLAGFGVPPLLRLRDVPPARVLRRDLGGVPMPAWSVYAAGLGCLMLIAWWQAGHLLLAAMVLGGALATAAVLALSALLVLGLLDRLRGRFGPAARFAVAGITRRRRASSLQVVAFGLGMLALMLLGLVRGELLEQWRSSLPDDAPNYFLINIQPDEVAALQAFMADNGLTASQIFPMIRGRVVAVNDRPFSPDDFSDPRAQRLAARDFNLSHAADRPAHNELLAGRWWGEGDASEAQFSMERGIGETLGIALGDRVRFDIAGIDVEGRVTSVREVEWDSFKVNFFFIGHPQLLGDQPSTYVTSVHLHATQRDLLAGLVGRHPSVTVIDVEALMSQVRSIMQHASLGVEYVFGFTLLAGLMVLLATIQATLDERRRDNAVLRTLGARRGQLLGALLAEFALLGALAGVLAAAAANLIAMVVASQIFGFSVGWQPALWLLGVLAGGTGVALAGYLGTRSVLDQPPLVTLRQV